MGNSQAHRVVAGAADPERFRGMDLLRLTTAGNVDDGKSTLIGRLLYDTRNLFEDQLEAVADATRRRGEEGVNLALLTDGLRAEREQNITIDVAYRYFATPRRKFIVADTPGHLQYTRNMVTGASTAELAVVLIDARKGVQTQSRRHGFLASLLGIPHLVVAVNKMDLVGFDEAAFRRIESEYRDFAVGIGARDVTFIPLSALRGDNVVEPSAAMASWYHGPTLLGHLETVSLGGAREDAPFRFPVQYVVRPHQDYRGFAGRIASGTLAAGDPVMVLPSGRVSRVRAVESADGPLERARAGESVVVRLEDEVDVSRGDLLASPGERPTVASRFEAVLCWTAERPLDPETRYLLLHTTRQVPALVSRVRSRIDVDTLEREPASTLALNDIGQVQVTTSLPICFDPYTRDRSTGSFVLVDPVTHATAAAGIIQEPGWDTREPDRAGRPVSPGVVWEGGNVARAEHERRNGHGAAVLWLTGLSGAGKTTIARALEHRLHERGHRSVLLDGDQLRHGLCGDLGFSDENRRENLRRAGEVARLFFEHGEIVICAFVSPRRDDRARVRALFPEGRFYEVHVDADLESCRARDPKGLYARASAGGLRGLTGVDAPYEAPLEPELRVDTSAVGVEAIVDALLARLTRNGVL